MIARSPWRNLLPALAFLALAVLLGSLVFQHRFREDLLVVLEGENLRVARLAASILDPTGTSGVSEAERKARVVRISELCDARVTVVTLGGDVIAESHSDPENMDNHANRPEIQRALQQGWGHSVRKSATLEKGMVYTAVRLEDSSGEPAGFVRVARSLEQVERITASIERTIWVAAGVVILMGLLACYLFIELRIAREDRVRVETSHRDGA